MIVAHRGASQDAPENTIPAFKLAWEQGVDAIEGDFQLTKDGHIVCIHDSSTKRIAERDLDISTSTLEELRQLDASTHHGKKYSNIIIPTIGEVFATIPAAKKIYIEIKCGIEIIPKLVEQIEKSGLKQDQIIMICFDTRMLQELKSKMPQYKTFWLCDFKKDKSGQITPSLETVLETLRHIKADGFSSGKDIVNEEFIKSVMQNGFEHHVWTVDNPDTAQRFQDWGTKSITTNVPDKIRKHLTKQGTKGSN